VVRLTRSKYWVPRIKNLVKAVVNSCNVCLIPDDGKFSERASIFRVVIIASSLSENGVSLNDILHAGLVLQSDLTIQILKWRYFRYVYSADIEKMYRQIWVDPKHSPF